MNTPKAAKPSPAHTPGSKENCDRVSISADAAFQRGFDEAVRAAARELEEPTDPQRLEEIREKVAGGRYFVPSEQLADAILERSLGLFAGL